MDASLRITGVRSGLRGSARIAALRLLTRIWNADLAGAVGDRFAGAAGLAVCVVFAVHRAEGCAFSVGRTDLGRAVWGVSIHAGSGGISIGSFTSADAHLLCVWEGTRIAILSVTCGRCARETDGDKSKCGFLQQMIHSSPRRCGVGLVRVVAAEINRSETLARDAPDYRGSGL